jgi:RNA polymerase sigma factor (sigma-70 family)
MSTMPIAAPASPSAGSRGRKSKARAKQKSFAGAWPRPAMAAPTEARIIERLKNGDPAALQTIFDRYAAMLHRLAQRILDDDADSAEVIQDVFWAVYRKAKTFKGESRLSTWLYRLTVNAALGRIRRRKRKRQVEFAEYLPKFHKDGRHAAHPLVDWSSALDEKYAAREVQALVGEALDQTAASGQEHRGAERYGRPARR